MPPIEKTSPTKGKSSIPAPTTTVNRKGASSNKNRSLPNVSKSSTIKYENGVVLEKDKSIRKMLSLNKDSISMVFTTYSYELDNQYGMTKSELIKCFADFEIKLDNKQIGQIFSHLIARNSMSMSEDEPIIGENKFAWALVHAAAKCYSDVNDIGYTDKLDILFTHMSFKDQNALKKFLTKMEDEY